MKTLQIRSVLLLIVWIQAINTFAQKIDNQTNSIISIKHHIEQNKNNRDEYKCVEIDGVIPSKIVRKKVAGIFNKTISQSFGGTFSETDIIKDTILISVRKWEREFLDSQKDSSKMSYKELIYDENRLCYYYEINKYERNGSKDSLIYEIELFLSKNEIIGKNMKGSIEPFDKFLEDCILYSEELYGWKREWVKKIK